MIITSVDLLTIGLMAYNRKVIESAEGGLKKMNGEIYDSLNK